MNSCPHCGHPEPKTVLLDSGPHFAKLVCPACHRHLKWLPQPESFKSDLSNAAKAKIRRRTKGAVLDGTSAQVKFALSIRTTKIAAARKKQDRRAFDVLMNVNDATWFIANKDRSISDLHWPAADQIENPRPTGECYNCGEDRYEHGTVCSMECMEEYTAYITRGK